MNVNLGGTFSFLFVNGGEGNHGEPGGRHLTAVC